MHIAQMLGRFDDLGDGFFTGNEQREDKTVGGIGGRDLVEKFRVLGHAIFRGKT